LHQFGEEAAETIAEIFAKIDCRLPEPSKWDHGPGAILTNFDRWEEVAKNYSFVEKLAKLQPRIKGEGNCERFEYWLNTFRFMKEMAHVGCTLGEFDKTMKKVNEQKNKELKKKLAGDVAIPLRKQLTRQWAWMVSYLLATVSNTGDMGTVANLEQHSMKRLKLLTGHDAALEEILGEPLPVDTRCWKDYRGVDRLIVPTVRTSLMADEDLNLKVILLTAKPPQDAALYWRIMGGSDYERIPLAHVARSVYHVTIPAEKIKGFDLEYHVVAIANGQELRFPATAPLINQTIIVMKPL